MAQEAMRNSIAGDAAMEARKLQTEAMPYTIKSGDFRLLATPAVGLDWNDNILLTRDNAQDDFIVRPMLGLNASYPITQRQLLRLDVTVGYQKYIQHDSLSTWYLQSGSELSFDLSVKDFLFNFHDRFSRMQDSAQQAAVANTGSYGTMQNAAGVNATWDLQDLVFTLGYDHLNLASTTSEFKLDDHSSELFVGRGGVRLSPGLTLGVEGTASLTAYDQSVLNDNAAYTAGIYGEWQPGRSFHVKPRVGYTTYIFQHTSQAIQTADLNSWYADLTVTHQITASIDYSLSAGHEVVLGIQSDALEDSYVRPNVNWTIIKGLGLQTGLFLIHGNQGAGNVRGNFTETFDSYGGSLSLSHAFTSRFAISLNYRLTLRSSSVARNEYTQDLVGLLLTYQPQ